MEWKINFKRYGRRQKKFRMNVATVGNKTGG